MMTIWDFVPRRMLFALLDSKEVTHIYYDLGLFWCVIFLDWSEFYSVKWLSLSYDSTLFILLIYFAGKQT